jgi:cytidine deaminase
VLSEELYEAALAACAGAYAPYSGFRVGAVLEAASGRRFTGVNVEFASYGLTICAERTALVCAVAAGERRFGRIGVAAVTGDRTEPAPGSPCGACRQALAEFGLDLEVTYLGPSGLETRTLGELLPGAFAAADLA